MSKRLVVDFQITGKCNMACKFCCGAEKKYPGPSFEDYCKTIDKLKRIGCTTIVLTGGEPLLRKDIVEMIKYAYNHGLEVYLSTNGLLLLQKYNEIKDYVGCIGLPLDGSTTKMNQKMTRGDKLFLTIDKILKYFKKNPPSHKVKIGTVVSSINKDDLMNIAKFLYKGDKYSPDVWRLYQFSALRSGKINQSLFDLSTMEYKRICDKVIKDNPRKVIVPLSDDESNDAYIFINPNLEIELLTNGHFVKLPNVLHLKLEELKSIIENQTITIEKGNMNRRWLKDGIALSYAEA